MDSTVAQKHHVTFYSPGTLFSETTTLPIPSWDRELAVAMSKTVTERYGAKPYGFKFSTETDGKETARSGMHHLGGKILTLADVEARQDPRDDILLTNMRCNGWDRVIENTNSWKNTARLDPGDVVVDGDGVIVAT